MVDKLVEDFAPIVFEAMRWAAQQPLRGDPPAWQNGNSFAEGRARDAANTCAAIAQKRVSELEAALREIMELEGEINPSNYDHDDVCHLNRQFCYSYEIARAALRQAQPTDVGGEG